MNRKTLNAIYTDLKLVIDSISEIENKKLYPKFHPNGITEEDEELLFQWEKQEAHLILKLAEEKGLITSGEN